ncbi:hypothetical protein Q7P37_011287 [Cladosporium fusiforme]
MKLISAALLSALSCYTELAAAATGYVLTVDHPQHQPSTDRQTLSPETARLVLAQRAGVEDYHLEKALSEEEIEAINEYGLKAPFMSSNEKRNNKRVFILAFGDEAAAEALAQKAHSFAISPAPSASETKSLFDDLATQSEEPYKSWTDEEYKQARGDSNLDAWVSEMPLYDVEMLVDSAMSTGAQRPPMTIILMPSTGSDASSWGSYSMPYMESPLQKRQVEKPLSEVFEAAPPAVETAPVSTPLTTFADKSGPLRGILPSCFRSQADCESITRNCTGHGKCRKLYHDRDAANGEKGDCYSCQCSATKEENKDGNVKTTVWGGPACQKKDVSIAFWLIALFTVGLVFLVSFAVGNLASMGSEELPSVIGAGVSGPVRK